MNCNQRISRIIATTAVAWMLASSVHAQVTSGRTRAEVEAEAVTASHAPNQNVTRGSRGAEPFNAVADPAQVRQQAVDTAKAPNQNVTRGSRGAEPFTPMADPQVVRAQAELTASAPDQNVTSGSRVNSKVVSNMPNPAQAQATSGGGMPAAK